MVEKNEVFEKVATCLVEALGVEKEEVTPEASLTKDLGAESIDFLDIVFRLEKAFGIKIPRGDLFPESLLSEAEYVENGKLTSAGLQKLKERLPYVDLTDFEKNPGVNEIADLFNVAMIVRYVTHKLSDVKGA